MSLTINQFVKRLISEDTIDLIKYEFREPPNEPKRKNENTLYIKKLWRDKLVNLSILNNFEISNDSVTRLMVELKLFEHDNVLRVYGITFDEDYYYFVREFSTMDLRTYLKKKSSSATPLTWRDRIVLTKGVVNGLKYLHDNDIIHSELHAKNIVMQNDIPKLTNIGMLYDRAPDDFSFSKYSPPEILLSHVVNDEKMLNIYSLGVLMWEISNDGIEPFHQSNAVELAIKILKGSRPDCSQIIEKLKNIPLSECYNEIKIENSTESRISEFKTINPNFGCELDYDDLLMKNMMKVKFISHFGLNRGRNLNGLDFNLSEGIILRDNSDPKICRTFSSCPVIYLPLDKSSHWMDLNNSSLFEIRSKNKMGPKYDDVRIHVPISTVQYTNDATDKFIQDIKIALNISNENKRRKALEERFNHYGNFVVKRATLGGVITIRNWSTVSAESKSYLKTYIQWAIDYGKGRTTEIFEDVPLDKLPKLEASVPIETFGDLCNWFKSLYSSKFAELISYEEIIPSYELLQSDLRKQLFQVIGSKPSEAPCRKLIPNISSQYEERDILKWIISNPPLNIHLSDWVYNNELQYGIILQRLNLKHGKRPAFKFLKEPKIIEINKITLLLTQPQTLQDAYCLENGINLKKDDGFGLELEIPFAEYSPILSYPLENFKYAKDQPSKAIYCQIIVRVAKISFNLADIKSLEEFSNTVNNALQNNEPYKNLCMLFGNDYGHLLPRTFTLGGILSKTYKSCTSTILPQRFEYDINDANTPQKIIKKLAEWNKEFDNIDTSYFLSNNSNLVYRNDIDNWIKNLLNKYSDLKVIASEDWTPLYKILKKIRFNIDDMFNTYQIAFNGEEILQQDKQDAIIIKFPGSLIDDNYYIFGTIIKRNKDGSEVKISQLPVQFDYLNKDGCVAYIHKAENCDIRLNKADTKLLWFVLANPKGYYSNKNRNVKVIYGDVNISKSQSVTLRGKNFSSDCVLITSIKNDTSLYNINITSWTKTKITLELIKGQIMVDSQQINDGFDDGSSDNEMDNFKLDQIDQATQETSVIRWCVIYPNVKMDNEDDESPTLSWSVFGNKLDPKLENVEPDYSDLYKIPSRMSLEDAINQFSKNDNTLEAWNTFVNHARDGNHIAKFWIGYYLQHDVLMAFKTYRRKFYEEVVDEFADGTDNYVQAAMKLYKQSADSGYPEAQLKYGFGLYNGTGVNNDKKEAIRYFRLAAKNNNITAMYNLGVMLRLSESDNEKNEGTKWLIEAAKLNHLKAIEVCNRERINY
ncbi:4470_t:CDS:2 [Scutellospora calospora]|uniref:4470_t:CDS:1 n=1 Tax=Scutellospora calospora TaxID=85575 RepID=A0ACA9K5Y1_9GLOM|nr:4470_t:CDS:2 [Scutellospora calospora]